MASDEENKLKTMQTKLADKKEDTAELRGEKQSLLKQLKAEGCKDVDEADGEATSEEKRAKKFRVELATGITELEKDYDWG